MQRHPTVYHAADLNIELKLKEKRYWSLLAEICSRRLGAHSELRRRLWLVSMSHDDTLRIREAADIAPALRCMQTAAACGVVKVIMGCYAAQVTISISSHVFVPVLPTNDAAEGCE